MLVLRIMVTSQKPVLKPPLLIPQNHEYDSENYIASFVLLSQKKLIIVLRVKNFRKTMQSVLSSVFKMLATQRGVREEIGIFDQLDPNENLYNVC